MPIANGQLVVEGGKTGAARIWLSMSSSEEQVEGGENDAASVTVTWNGDKIRTGSSHRCETREGEVSEERKAALDKALTQLGVDIEELTEEDQVSAKRVYLSPSSPLYIIINRVDHKLCLYGCLR